MRSAVLGVAWKVNTPELEAAFRRDWSIGMTLAELAALYGYTNINSVTRTARRLGLPKRAGGPRDDAYSPGVLRGGQWVRRGLTHVWLPDDEEAA